MDDLALLDLLECPVCFEKLDATAKVLPCQHTFCKPCLQRILKSQKELRCPECRTLVLCSIEQLPSNLLLIRLLDGVRCGQNVARFGSMQRTGLLSSPASIRRVPRGLQLHQHRLATNPRLHMEGVPRAKALYTYRGHNPGELRFNKGDIIVLLRQLDENWYLGEVNGLSGVFPASSVQVIKHLPLPVPLSRALGSFDTRGRDRTENKESLTLHKVTAAPRAGLGPCVSCVTSETCHRLSLCLFQPNTTARQLLQTSKSHWSPQFKCTSLRTASPKAKGADSPAFPKVPDSRRKSLRQFSITTALNTLNRMVHSPERQALEISSPVLISSSNPTVATQSSEKAELPYSTPIQVSASYYPAPGSLGHSAAIVTLPHLQHHMSAYIVALNPALPPAPSPRSEASGISLHLPSSLFYHQGSNNTTAPPHREQHKHNGEHRPVTLNSLIKHPNHRAGKPNLSDSKMPSLYATWTLSTSSLSSQGSAPEHGPRQSRPLKPALLPVPVPSPGRSAAAAGPGPAPLRRGRGSARKNGSLQRPGQAGTPIHVAGSLRRPLTTVLRPQQIQLYPHLSPALHSIPAEAGARTHFSHDASPVLVIRGGESRTPSVCSSVVLDAKDPPAKSEAAPKPPASAPPSILVKPESSRNSAEKQVKTVRFQNHSPPPPKRH
ncbi:SH3R2 ligase, partial [Amazona guildingii]|nr:SH3R2 ligase [Amazona guildingii]